MSSCANTYFAQQNHDDAQCVTDLLKGVRQVHDEVRTEAEREGRPGAATTLTLVVLFWPKAYLVHVGDWRAYRLRDNPLQLLSHDQTVAQALVDAGALTASKGEMSPLKHILTSAIGAEEATPEVQVDTARPDDILLLCTDGLTKRVSDEGIAARLQVLGSSEQACRNLVDDALDWPWPPARLCWLQSIPSNNRVWSNNSADGQRLESVLVLGWNPQIPGRFCLHQTPCRRRGGDCRLAGLQKARLESASS